MQLNELYKMFKQSLLEQDIHAKQNSGIFKQQIMERFPYLQDERQGRHVVFVTPAISEMFREIRHTRLTYRDLIIAADICRQAVEEHQVPMFEGKFEDTSQENAIPQSLKMLVSSLFYGSHAIYRHDQLHQKEVLVLA